MGIVEELLTSSKANTYTDMRGYRWASKYVNYALEKSIVEGYGDGTFKPSKEVNYNEIIAMLVKALGWKAEGLFGECYII